MTSSTPGKPSVMDKIKDTVQKVTHTGAHSDSATTSHSTTHTGHTTEAHTTTGTGIGAHDTMATGAGPAPTTAGPHTSDTMNKMDPRVDSDLSGSRTGMTGGSNYGTSTYGTSGAGLTSGSATGTGYDTAATTGSGYNAGSTTVGPHSSDTMNKLDPRVDSDLSGTRSGYGATGTGTTSSNIGGTGNTGYGSSGVTSMSSGPGPAPNTAGPHSSDMLNKMDPRVDSDLDGSKTMGQTNNPTY